jgi:hypothetical protein
MPSAANRRKAGRRWRGYVSSLSSRARESEAWSVNFCRLMPGVEGPSKLPGGELVSQGIRDLERGVESAEALLVSIGAPRLRRLGFALPRPFASPEHRLYELLRAQHGDAAHSRYNALVRRLVSFERAAGTVSVSPRA